MEELKETAAPAVPQETPVAEESIFVTFVNSIGFPVKAVDQDGKPLLNAAGEQQFVPGTFRHYFEDGKDLASVKLPWNQLQGEKRLKLKKQTYNGVVFYRCLGIGDSSSVEKVAVLADLSW